MRYLKIFDPKKNLKLFGLSEKFNFLANLNNRDILPKVILLSGSKGSGKATLVNHLMHFFFNKKNYDEKKKIILEKDNFFNHYIDDLCPNIIYLNGLNHKYAKIEDIRELKNKLNKSSISSNKRFIIFDDVETFNHNSLNALLKIIEEPSKNNYFILINNESKKLLETIKSRCFELKITLDIYKRSEIINKLLSYFDQEIILDQTIIKSTPGNFLKYNFILSENKINFEEKFIDNLNLLLSLHKKEKDIFFKDLLIFFSEYTLKKMKINKIFSTQKFIENRSYIVKNINEYFLLNLNQTALINSIGIKINNG